ncbi:MAG TPA: sigma-E factor negative regulatory protein [Steroidobacteraceae bacterium]|nr:sigma-E factor negative regulatory protein [Steroidobacteraceae bacterium]
MNEELDSQLSAMFDDELAPEQCELLARRLSRDEQLKARWGRYAVIGAAIRSERGVRLNAPLAGRVSAVLLAEPALATAPGARPTAVRWWQPLAGAAVAAGVAVASVLWLRAQDPLAGAPLSAHLTAATVSVPSAPVVPAAAAGAAQSYVVPRTPAVRAMVPSTELANYVVAHSVFSSPVARRNLLSAFMTSESGTAAEEPPDEPVVHAQ